MDKFKVFLLNEEKSYLGRKVANVLTPMQELQDDMQNMGARHLVRVAEKLVNEIRKILHGHWEQQQQHFLKDLQKIAVAIQKTIEEKGDLREIIPAAIQSMQTLSGKLGTKINNLQAPELEDASMGSQPPQQGMPQQQDQGVPPA